MKNIRLWISLCFVLSTFILQPSSFAQVPQLINYQGRLLNGTNLVNGSVELSLQLFDAATFGTLLYEDSNTVTVSDGLYSTYIGDDPVDVSFLAALTNAEVYVQVSVNGTTLSPRERLASVGYSLATRGISVDLNNNIFVHNPAENAIDATADHSTIGGGRDNSIRVNASYTVIGGGEGNSVADDATHAVVAGGYYNNAGGIASTVPGGQYNDAANTLSFAAGNRAKAYHVGSFVWGDVTDEDIGSTNDNSVTMRATGGFRLFTAPAEASGVELAAGDGAWTTLSDRNAKDNFTAVDTSDILQKIAAMPVLMWNYKTQDAGIRHIGPMAQDFKVAFGLGATDTGITTVDADGVALAAIQALKKENDALRAQNEKILKRLEKLEADQSRNY